MQITLPRCFLHVRHPPVQFPRHSMLLTSGLRAYSVSCLPTRNPSKKQEPCLDLACLGRVCTTSPHLIIYSVCLMKTENRIPDRTNCFCWVCFFKYTFFSFLRWFCLGAPVFPPTCFGAVHVLFQKYTVRTCLYKYIHVCKIGFTK